MLKRFKQVLLLMLKNVFLPVPLSILLICQPGSTTTPEAEVVHYTQKLTDENAALIERVDAASALGNPFLGKDDAIYPLTIALRQDSEAAVRSTAALALANRSSNPQRQALLPLFELGVPALIDALDKRQESNSSVRAKAAEALGEIIRQSKSNASLTEQDELVIDRAVTSLLNVLEDKAQGFEVRAEAAYALGLLGESAQSSVGTLIDILSNETENNILRARAADALGFLGSAIVSDIRAVPVLIKVAKENEVGLRLSSTFALGAIGADAEIAIPTLINILKQDPELEVRRRSARALSTIAFDSRSIAALVAILKNEIEEDGLRITAASSLGNMAETFNTSLPSEAIAVLVDTLKREDSELQANAALALKSTPGAESAVVIPALIPLLQDRDWVSKNAAEALKQIVVRFQDEDKNTQRSLNELEQLIFDAEKTAVALREAGFSEYIVDVDRSLESLRFQRQTRILEQALDWFRKNPWHWLLLCYLIGLPTFWSIIFWLRPLWLLKLDHILAPLKSTELPSAFAGGFSITLQTLLYITFFEFFHYRHRVLDAWVANYLKNANLRFEEDKTVNFHEIRVPITITLNGNSIPALASKDLQPTFSRNLSYVLIMGEGGSGKTSLACQIARWGMLGQKKGLCDHIMLPVLIDHDFNWNITEGKNTFIQAICRQLQQLIDENQPILEDLLKHLLQQRRILVILDGLSEMSEDTQQSIRFGEPEFPVNALIVTSRIPKIIKGIDSITEIEPQKLEKDALSNFIRSYLEELRKYDLFDSKEYFNDCLHLTELVGGRGITVLLAKLYVEEMVKKKESGSNNPLPRNIPDLMLSYLNKLNSKYKDDIQKDMKKIAWESLKETFQPEPVKREDVLTWLSDKHEIARDKIEHFEEELGLIKTLFPDNDLLQITLDPLAEYLAGLYVLENNGVDGNKWHNFMERIDSKDMVTVQGFLLAIQDCCDYRKNLNHPRFAHIKPPDFVLTELDMRIQIK